MLLDVLVLLLLVRFDDRKNNKRQRRRSNRMSLRICQIALLLLSSSLVQSASLPEKSDVSQRSSVASATTLSQERSRSLLQRIACAVSCGSKRREARQVKYNDTQRSQTRLVNQNSLQDVFPHGKRGKIRTGDKFYPWVMWKRNSTYMFAISKNKNGTDPYFFLTVHNNRVTLTKARADTGIDENEQDPRYFRMYTVPGDGKNVLQHIKTGLFIGVEDEPNHGDTEIVVAVKEYTKAGDWSLE